MFLFEVAESGSLVTHFILVKGWTSLYEAKGGELYRRGDTLSRASDGRVTWSVLAPWAMWWDLNTGQLCALIG